MNAALPTTIDQYLSQLRATLSDAGESGHINVESGHGPWPEGLLQFGQFLRKLG